MQCFSAMCREDVYLEVKADGVNGQPVAPCKVLQRARQEGLREEQAADPEARRRALLGPGADEVAALLQVCHPAAERLEAGVCSRRPELGDLRTTKQCWQWLGYDVVS